MKGKNRFVTTLLCVAACAFAGRAASGANIITNADFETGTLAGWLTSGTGGSGTITIGSPDNGPSAAGSKNAFLSNNIPGNGMVLYQFTGPATISAGQTLTWSFDAKADALAIGGVYNFHLIAIGTGDVGVVNQQFNSPALPVDGNWHTFTGSFVPAANGDHLQLQLEAVTGAAEGSVANVHFDNVLVCTGGTCTNGGGGGGVTNQVQATIAQGVGISWFASNGVTYQVQFLTDLVNSNWANFGSQSTGAGSSNTVFDAYGSTPQKFYRVLSLQ